MQRHMTERNFNLIDKLDEVGRAHGRRLLRCPAWLSNNPVITAPIVGANTVEQLRKRWVRWPYS